MSTTKVHKQKKISKNNLIFILFLKDSSRILNYMNSKKIRK